MTFLSPVFVLLGRCFLRRHILFFVRSSYHILGPVTSRSRSSSFGSYPTPTSALTGVTYWLSSDSFSRRGSLRNLKGILVTPRSTIRTPEPGSFSSQVGNFSHSGELHVRIIFLTGKPLVVLSIERDPRRLFLVLRSRE